MNTWWDKVGRFRRCVVRCLVTPHKTVNLNVLFGWLNSYDIQLASSGMLSLVTIIENVQDREGWSCLKSRFVKTLFSLDDNCYFENSFFEYMLLKTYISRIKSLNCITRLSTRWDTVGHFGRSVVCCLSITHNTVNVNDPLV